jgi:hypothetical protein
MHLVLERTRVVTSWQEKVHHPFLSGLSDSFLQTVQGFCEPQTVQFCQFTTPPQVKGEVTKNDSKKMWEAVVITSAVKFNAKFAGVTSGFPCAMLRSLMNLLDLCPCLLKAGPFFSYAGYCLSFLLYQLSS